MASVHQNIQWPSLWEDAKAFARGVTDAMGCPIDEGILETVVGLNLLGLPTCQSCEGHLDEGLPYPWIDFETDEFPVFTQAVEDASCKGLSAEEQEARGARLVEIAATLPSHGILYTRLEELLRLYYHHYPATAEEFCLTIHVSSPILFRLMPWCGYHAWAWDDATRMHKLCRTQAEMRTFSAFLKQRVGSHARVNANSA